MFHSFEEGQEEAPTSEASSHVARPSTPPSRREAFEQFKRGRGSEINKILVSNKSVSGGRKGEGGGEGVGGEVVRREGPWPLLFYLLQVFPL